MPKPKSDWWCESVPIGSAIQVGPQAGQPKLPTAVQSMLERGLVEVRTGRGPRAVFTPAGLAALRRLLTDRRAMDPIRFAHLRRELGVDRGEDGGDERTRLTGDHTAKR